MNENINRIYEDEKTVDLLNFCFYVLRKWKIMMIAAAIVAVVMGGLSYVKSYRESQKADNNQVEIKEPNISEYDREAVLAKIEMIEEHKACVEEYEYYYENSIKAKLNPNGIPQGRLSYLISAGNIQDVVKAIEVMKENVLSEENMKILSEGLSSETDEAMVREVIDFSGSYIAEHDSEESVSGVNDAKLDITVRHYNREDCEVMLAFFENQIEVCREFVSNAQITLLSSKIEITSDRTLATLSKDTMNGKLGAYEAILKIEKEMTEDQRAYYDYIKGNEDKDDTANIKSEVSHGKPNVNIGYVIIGAIAGAFCVAAFYVVVYLFGGRVRSKEELKSWLLTPVLDDSDENLLAAHVMGIAANEKTETLFFTGSLDKPNAEKMLQIKNILVENGVNVVLGNSILKDAKALQEASECRYMVLMEKCHISKEKDIREEVVKASSCGIRVLSVILEK